MDLSNLPPPTDDELLEFFVEWKAHLPINQYINRVGGRGDDLQLRMQVRTMFEKEWMRRMSA